MVGQTSGIQPAPDFSRHLVPFCLTLLERLPGSFVFNGCSTSTWSPLLCKLTVLMQPQASPLTASNCPPSSAFSPSAWDNLRFYLDKPESSKKIISRLKYNLVFVTGAQSYHGVFNIWLPKDSLPLCLSRYTLNITCSDGGVMWTTMMMMTQTAKFYKDNTPASTISTQLVFTNLMLGVADLANRGGAGAVLMGTSFFGPAFVGLLCMLILPYFSAKAGHAANDLSVLNLYKRPQSRLGKPHKPKILHLTVFFDGFCFFFQSLQLQSSKVSDNSNITV